jgi:ferric iron reductase protein FhuF
MPQGPEWFNCAELLRDPAQFKQWQTTLSQWLFDNYAMAPVRTTASYIMTWYFHMPAFLGALLLHHERRVPTLHPEEMSFRLSTQRPNPDAMAISGTQFYCLASDPESMDETATVVANEQALAAVFRARYTAHAAQFITAYTKVSPFGARTLWAAATDALDNSLWLTGKHAGAEGEGVANASLVLDRKYPPLTSASTLRLEEKSDGQRKWFRRRESCCFSYLLPQEAECENCPRVCPKR